MYHLNLRRRTVITVALVCSTALFAIFQYWTYSPRGFIRQSSFLMGNQDSPYCQYDEPDSMSMMLTVCGCPDVNTPSFGFPYRINKYDSCHVDGRAQPQVVATNYALQIGFVVLFYLGLKRLLEELS